ncbi:hypothetical protein cyc_04975 [Cyclospora cayetanensis]|uniref:Uncharacterized protein n=1 Tax=Cyclospora cayetanensis TaxID=88456 RepID=A0A1D3CXF1_9EIME|nr:hypothetical protein cyc_04975 [Cyclospora cayetanensis]
MQPSRRWFLAGGCWLMACLVAQGALRVASAVSISRSVGVASGASSTLSLGVEGSAAGGGVHQGEAPSLADALSKGSREGAVAALEADRLNCDAEGCASYPAAAREGCASACTLAEYSDWMLKCIEGHLIHQQQQQQNGLVGASIRLLRAVPTVFTESVLSCVNTLAQQATSAYGEGKTHARRALRTLNQWSPFSGWKPLGFAWRQRLRQEDLTLLRIEAGGWGDCLFLALSMAFGLNGMKEVAGDALKLRQLAANGIVGINPYDSQAELSPKEEAAFLDRLAVIHTQGVDGGRVEGGGGHAELGRYRSSLLSALAVFGGKGVIFDVSSTMGKVRAVHHELGRPGNNHWGTAADICALENELDVGILVLDGARGTFYVTGSENKRRQAYVLLYFKGACHFQLVGVQTPEGIKTLLYPEELPKALIRFFKEDTKHDLLGGSAVSDKSTKHLHDTDTAVRSNRQRG